MFESIELDDKNKNRLCKFTNLFYNILCIKTLSYAHFKKHLNIILKVYTVVMIERKLSKKKKLPKDSIFAELYFVLLCF